MRSARWGLGGNLALTIVKVGVGLLAHSEALIADGIHSAADLGSSLAVAIGLRVANLPPDAGHNYGHAKAEAVAQKVVALLLILTGFEIGSHALAAFAHPEVTVPGVAALAVAAGAALIKWLMYASQRRVALQTGSHALMASARDNIMDVASSVIATAAILAARLGIAHSDAAGAVVVAGLVVWLGIGIFSEAANDLMDRAAAPDTVEAIRQACLTVSGVRGVTTIRTRMAGAQVLADLEIEVDRDLTLLAAHGIAHRVEAAVLGVPRVESITVHVNPAPDPRSTH